MKCSSPKVVHGRLVSCNRCFSCSSRKSSDWTVRAQKDVNAYRSKGVRDGYSLIEKSDLEEILGRDALSTINMSEDTDIVFGDCTYDNAFLPDNQSLDRSDFVKFKKRFRKRIKKIFGVDDVRILYSGEYGENGTNRPHYHYLIWNLPKCSIKLYRRIIEDAWNMGFVKVSIPDSVSYSAHYVSKYVSKSDSENFYALKSGEKLEDYIKRTGKEVPPFVGASMGLGLEYIEKNAYAISKLGYIPDGKYKVSIPRYYKNKMKGMLNYSIVHSQIKSELDFKPKNFNFDYEFNDDDLDEIVNYKLYVEKLRQDVAAFKADYSSLFSYARRLGIEISGIFDVESLQFSDDIPVNSVKFSNSDILADPSGIESPEEFSAYVSIMDVLRKVRVDFSERFFGLYSDLFFFESRLSVIRYLQRRSKLNRYWVENADAVKANADAYKQLCKARSLAKLERKRLNKYAIFKDN